jgi:plasmid stabilization system protein ParE
VTRIVELRPAARRDLLRFDKFLARMSPSAAERRTLALRKALHGLGDAPFAGRPAIGDFRQVVISIGRARYVARYRVTDDAVIITRIWHGHGAAHDTRRPASLTRRGPQS